MATHRSPWIRRQAQTLGATVSEMRAAIRWSQRELSRRSGVPQSVISRMERAQPSDIPLSTLAALLEAMGGRLRVEVDAPALGNRTAQREPAHARMSGHVGRRLDGARWLFASEVEIGGDRSRGWIDILAFNPRTGLLLVIELKTEIHDLGQIDRTLGWYEREAWAAARRLGWRPTAVMGCLILLMTGRNDAAVRFNREILGRLFALRAATLDEIIEEDGPVPSRGSRALAMVDPRSKRRRWLRPTTDDGRRSRAPYADYADFMRALAG